jgi:hypothetical protein
MATAPHNNRKRPFGALVRTLNDITNNPTVPAARDDVDGYDANDSGGAGDGGGGKNGKISVRHIPSLPDEKIAASILRRIHAEFGTIIEKRGWVVTSITEMCCCGDGLDCSSSRAEGGRRRKLNIMPNNVLGYNRTTTASSSSSSSSSGRGGSSHDIHLRLRNPRTHVLYDYESIAGTMCHELAHCVRGSHDAKFYAAMEEIEEQHATYLARGVVLGRDGFPVGDVGVVLGGGGGGGVAGGRGASSSSTAAESRRNKGRNRLTRGGYVLGGGDGMRGECRPPREAARIAAERRLLDSQFCLPCNEVIEILGEDDVYVAILDDDGDDDGVEVVERSTKSALSTADNKIFGAKTAANDDGVIDLTLDESFTTANSRGDTLESPFKPEARVMRMARPGIVAARSDVSDLDLETSWTCHRCTLFNRPTVLVCIACRVERPCDGTVVEHANESLRQDDVDEIKRREVQQSRETFGGFNIYGERRDSSSTMKHLT